MIGPLDDASVLDLYAGSGAMGLEALSRGAARVVFVESDPDAIAVIAQNLEKLRMTGAEIAREDAGRRVAVDARAGRRYDLVFIDPPYRMLDEALTVLAPHLPNIIAPHGLAVVESDARELPELPLPQRTTRRYGSTRLTLFEAPA
jgi:16S rRNA (guanine966-N2)-methyltransferase